MGVVERNRNPIPQVGESGGVFRDLVNQRAFFDSVTVSLWGEMESGPEGIMVTRDFAIGGRTLGIGQRRRFYARSRHGVCSLTGNPFELRYGRLIGYTKLPQFRLILRSRNRPVSLAELVFLLNSLFRPGFKGYVAQVELTFDLSGIDADKSARRLFTSARRLRSTASKVLDFAPAGKRGKKAVAASVVFQIETRRTKRLC
jgi:hypothetical protein